MGLSRSVRLGCLPHSSEKAGRLPAARYGAALPPASIPAATWRPTLYDNDTNPTCVPIALAHAARAWSIRQGGDDVAIPLSAIDGLYSQATGVPLARIAASDGSDPMDVVETAQGRGWNVGGQVPLVPDFATLQIDRAALALGIARSGSVMLAVTLYEADMDAFEAGRPWMLGGAPGDVLGGHMVAACSYDGLADSQSVQIATWGVWQPARWDWVLARLRLGLVTGFRQLLGPDRVADYETMWQTAAA